MVNQHTVTMTFVYSYLEQLLHSQNNLVLNLTWRGCVFLSVNLYTFVLILKWLYVLRIFFPKAETGFNEAGFSWCKDEL